MQKEIDQKNEKIEYLMKFFNKKFQQEKFGEQSHIVDSLFDINPQRRTLIPNVSNFKMIDKSMAETFPRKSADMIKRYSRIE